MATKLPQGTKEYLILDVADKLANLTSLDGTNPRFDVKDNANVFKYTAQPASNVGMELYCLVDTSAAHPGGLWAGGIYRLYVNFDTPAEIPRLGPFEFTVDAS